MNDDTDMVAIDPELTQTSQMLHLLVAEGLVEIVGLNNDGQTLYRITDAGTARVQALLTEPSS